MNFAAAVSLVLCVASAASWWTSGALTYSDSTDCFAFRAHAGSIQFLRVRNLHVRSAGDIQAGLDWQQLYAHRPIYLADFLPAYIVAKAWEPSFGWLGIQGG